MTGSASDSSGSDSGATKKMKKLTSKFTSKLQKTFKRGSSSSSSDEEVEHESQSKATNLSSSSSSLTTEGQSNVGYPSSKRSSPSHNSTEQELRQHEHFDPDTQESGQRRSRHMEATNTASQFAVVPAHKLPAVVPTRLAPNDESEDEGAGEADARIAVVPEPKPRTAETPRVVPGKPEKRNKPLGRPVFGPPEIVLTGVKGHPDDVMKVLRTRGFVVHLSMLHEESTPPMMTIVLAMGPKLIMKSAVERNLPTKARGEYTSAEASQLCADAIGVIKRSSVEYDEVNLLHDKKALERVANAEQREAADVVHSYFGPYIGIYFAWLRYYTWALVFPGVPGIVLFLDQCRTGTADSPLLPVFCVFIMVWCAIWMDMWKRRNSAIAFKWGVDGVEDEELMRASASKPEGEVKSDPAGKLCLTIPIILAAIYGVIRAMLYCLWLRDHATEVYGEDSYMQHFPTLLYSGVPIVFSTVYESLAKALNDFEGHPTGVRKKNMLIVKMFAFQFVNSYCALLYVAFWLRDLDRLRTLLMTMMMAKQFMSQVVEKYKPRAKLWLKDRKEKLHPGKEPKFLVRHEGTISPEDLHDEMKAEPADVEDDFLEMVLQFGYVSMFAVVFPLAPVFAILNNLWEFRIDINALVKTRRPQAHAESTIGAWQICLELIAIVACLTNLLLTVFVSKHVNMYVPGPISQHLGSVEAKVMLVVVIEHVLFMTKIVAAGVIDEVPRVVRQAQFALAVQQKQERKELRRLANGLPASPESALTTVGEKALYKEPDDRLRDLYVKHDVWKFGPLWYLPLALIPFMVVWLQISALWVMPLALAFVSYLQHLKDGSDKALALGVVKDPKVLRLVTGFLPPWYTDSEVERVEWLNKVLGKMWVTASGATEDLFNTTIQPILDSYRPAGINALGFRKVSLGTIPPKVVGVRALEMKGDKAIIDIDMRWAGNAEFVVEAGVKPVPLLVTLNKICFSGRMRVELAPLVPVFPCFGAVVLTFMEEPFIDFKFSLGKLEVMSLGPGDLSVGRLVSQTIKNAVTSLMVFPVKMVVPILEEQDILALSNPTPTGVVELTVVGADKLRSADFDGKSDPYVKIKLGQDQEMETEVQDGTLDPRWDQTFDLMVYERSVEVIEFSVFDKDSGPGDDDKLGICELPLSVLQADIQSAHNLPLSNTTSGSLLLRATFVPLSSGAKRIEDPDEDVLIDVAGDDITDEMVATQRFTDVDAGTSRVTSKPSTDPSALAPAAIVTDTSMGVISVMGIECKGVKPGDRYVSVVCGNTKRKTAVVKDASHFVCPEVFHYLVKGAKSARVEILLKEKESLGSDKCLGSFKVSVGEVMANDDLLDGEWDLEGEKAKGSIKMRLKWAGRAGDD